MEIRWELERQDEAYDEHPADTECLIEIEGTIEHEGQVAGELSAHYLYAERPESPAAFLGLWEMTGTTCGVYEEILSDTDRIFRDPLPDMLAVKPGIMCVNYIALRPAFRHRGLGREVMRELVHQMVDSRVGAVLLDCQPLQHRPRGFDDFDQEVRELPWNSPATDLCHLLKHFGTWGMRRVVGTSYVAAAPGILCEELAADWYPGLLGDPDDFGLEDFGPEDPERF